MNNKDVIEYVKKAYRELTNNSVHLPQENTDVAVLDEPLIGFAAADDPIYETYKKPEVIGPEWMAPREWMEDAHTVITLFFPRAEGIRTRLAEDPGPVVEAAELGFAQAGKCAVKITAALIAELESHGIKVCSPGRDPRSDMKTSPFMNGEDQDLHFCPTWSDKHAAYACGLGTFGLHRHIITEKGCCGTLASFITDHEFDPSPRPYTGVCDNCIMCGACVQRCPAGAITMEHSRNLMKCIQYGDELEKLGGGECARCMAGVPCEHRNPAAKEKAPV
ncbi:MAG: 4Fe-4S binding protein [Solobacterium sp.]|nr:4Fe-4S binding protein [Solobacterium sp.]